MDLSSLGLGSIGGLGGGGGGSSAAPVSSSAANNFGTSGGLGANTVPILVIGGVVLILIFGVFLLRD